MRNSLAVFVALLLMAVIAGTASGSPPDDADEPGVTADDQASETGDDDPPGYASAPVVTPTGTAFPGTYTTEAWDNDEATGLRGVNVVVSADPYEVAFSGVVSRSDGEPVTGATVKILRSRRELPPPEPFVAATASPESQGVTPVSVNTSSDATVVVQAVTDGDGAFAFKDIPQPSAFYSLSLIVDAAGYGTYQHDYLDVFGGEAFFRDVELSSSPQYIMGTPDTQRGIEPDDSPSAASSDSAAAALTTADVINYVSRRHVPPTISVAEFTFDATCTTVPGSTYTVKSYPWRYYMYKVLAQEVGGAFTFGTFNQQATKAVAMAIQTFAWHHKILAGSGLSHGGADVDNTVNSFQCFNKHKSIPVGQQRAFKSWLEDVLDERVVDQDGTMKLVQHASDFNDECVEPANTQFAPGKNFVSQRGARAKESNCGMNQPGDWRSILNYYLSHTPEDDRRILAVSKPPTPQASYTRSGNVVHFKFPSVAADSQGRRSNVAWQYYLYRKVAGGEWRRIRRMYFSWRSTVRTVPTTTDVTLTSCAFYRIAATNPGGLSPYAPFTDVPGSTTAKELCPQ